MANTKKLTDANLSDPAVGVLLVIVVLPRTVSVCYVFVTCYISFCTGLSLVTCQNIALSGTVIINDG